MNKCVIFSMAMVLMFGLVSCTNDVSGTSSEKMEISNLTDQEIYYDVFLPLHEQALSVTLGWYLDDPAPDLEISRGEPAPGYENYYKVGRFQTIEEMKIETERYFTTEYCESHLYGAFKASSDKTLPQYIEVDDALYRNTMIGGTGWPYELAKDYVVTYKDNSMLSLAVTVSEFEKKEIQKYFELINDDGEWKVSRWYDDTPFTSYNQSVPTVNIDNLEEINSIYVYPLFASGAARESWDRASEIEPDRFNGFIACIDELDEDIDLNSYEVEEQFGNILMPAADYEKVIKKYFDVSPAHLRQSRYFKPDTEIYEIIGVGSAATSKVLGAKQDGAILSIQFDSYSGNRVGNSYHLKVKLLDQGFEYLSCTIEPTQNSSESGLVSSTPEISESDKDITHTEPETGDTALSGSQPSKK